MDESGIYLGIDLGGTDIKYVALGQSLRMLESGSFSTGGQEGREAVMGRLVELVRSTAEKLPLRSVGMAVPCVLDMEAGRVELMTNLTRDWDGFLLRDAMESRTGFTTHLLNDVRAATLAEQQIGAGRGYRDFICVAIGTGIGGGLVIDGELFMGSRGAAGEVGHQTILPNGPRCNCGNRGCLEALASGPAIARVARDAIEAGDRALADAAGSQRPSPQHVAQAAEVGNQTARDIFTQAGHWIGLGMGNLVVVLNPQAVVVGGGVAAAGELLLAPIRQEIERRTSVFSKERGGVDVLLSPLGGQAGAIGAAVWARQHSAGCQE